MVVLILFFLIGVLNAFMDTVEEGHFSKSIFSHLDPKFWYKWQSWKYAKRIKFSVKKWTVVDIPIDAWHIAKFLMWVCVCIAPIVYRNAGPIFPVAMLDFAAMVGVLGLTFNLFYDHIFKKP